MLDGVGMPFLDRPYFLLAFLWNTCEASFQSGAISLQLSAFVIREEIELLRYTFGDKLSLQRSLEIIEYLSDIFYFLEFLGIDLVYEEAQSLLRSRLDGGENCVTLLVEARP